MIFFVGLFVFFIYQVWCYGKFVRILFFLKINYIFTIKKNNPKGILSEHQ